MLHAMAAMARPLMGAPVQVRANVRTHDEPLCPQEGSTRYLSTGFTFKSSVVCQCYVEGVSTRRVDGVVKAMGIEGISKSQVS